MKKILLIIDIACMALAFFAAIFTLVYMCEGAIFVYDAIGMQHGTWYIMLVHLLLLATVILDVTCWVEINVLYICQKLGAFKGIESMSEVPRVKYPKSIWYTIYKNCKEN